MLFLENTWVFPLLQSVHLVGIAVLVGTIVLVDVRLLGFGPKPESAIQLAGELSAWTRSGLAVMLLTGSILFGANASRYVANPAFQFKLVCLAIALLFHFRTRARWLRRAGPGPFRARLVGAASMLLWTCVILSGRAIADFDV